jgi:hypothetical protein
MLAAKQKKFLTPETVFGKFTVPEMTTVTSSKMLLSDGYNKGVPVPGRSYRT